VAGGVVADGQSDQTVKLAYTGRRHAWLIACGDDARDDTESAVYGSVPSSADLTVSASDAAAPWVQPDEAHHRTGFTS
jgi:hypothetical protein